MSIFALSEKSHPIRSLILSSSGRSHTRDLIASPQRPFLLQTTSRISLPSTTNIRTMAEIKIDKTLFQERLSHFYSAWKADKRSGDTLFNGASSILVLMGKTEEAAQFQKNNAIHVRISSLEGRGEARKFETDFANQFWLLGYEFPATLFLFTLDALYIVTTSKKGKLPVADAILRGAWTDLRQQNIWSP